MTETTTERAVDSFATETAVTKWLADFERALTARDLDAAAALFVKDCYWRDLVAFTWNIITIEGPEGVRKMLAQTLDQVQPSGFDVVELIEELRPRAGDTHPLRLDAPESLHVTTDRAKLAQAIGNLLDNAAKFSPPGSAIDIRVKALDGTVRVGVRDHGPGISPEHWQRIFERFYKVDRARPREAGGFGLGLAITKHLVQSLGGKVWTEAADEGGQVFTIELPTQALTSP